MEQSGKSVNFPDGAPAPPYSTDADAQTTSFKEPPTQTKASGSGPPDETDGDAVDYEEAFEMTGQGRFNHVVLIAGTLVFVHSLLEIGAVAYIVTPADCDLRMTVFEKSMINSAIFIGICMTSIGWGVVIDQFGRRVVILPTVIGGVISSFISSLCTQFWFMFTFRLLTGCLISASSATSLVYVAELHTNQYRDKAIGIMFLTGQITFVLTPALALIILHRQWSFYLGSIQIRPWRTFMWTWGLFGLSGAIILFFLPESPRFILATKGPMKVQPILADIYAKNFKKEPLDFPVGKVVKHLKLNLDEISFLNRIVRDLWTLLRPPMFKCFALIHICMFMTYISANGLYMWLPDFINEALKTLSSTESICGLIQRKYHSPKNSTSVNQKCDPNLNMMVYPTAIAMEMSYMIPFLTVIFLINRFSKIRLYAYITWISAIFLALSSFVPQMALALLCMALVPIVASCIALLSAMAMEVFPTSIRALAMCTMLMAGQIGAVVGNSVIAIMIDAWCVIICFGIALIAAGAAVALVRLWPDATKLRQQMERKGYTY